MTKNSLEKLGHRIEELTQKIAEVNEFNPLVFIRNAEHYIEPERVCVFASSFNPPTVGHETMIRTILSKDWCQELILVISRGHISKESFQVSEAERIILTELMTTPYKNVSIAFAFSGKFIKIAHNLEAVVESEISFLMGSDNFHQMIDPEINSKRDLNFFFEHHSIFIAARGEEFLGPLMQGLDLDWVKKIREITFGEGRQKGISSTIVRDKIAKGESPDDLLHPEVYRAIKELNLYK